MPRASPSNGLELTEAGTLFRASQFLAEELPIRLAHRVQELDDLPDGLNEMSSVIKVKDWYAQSFEVRYGNAATPVHTYVANTRRKSHSFPGRTLARMSASDSRSLHVATVHDKSNGSRRQRRTHPSKRASHQAGVG